MRIVVVALAGLAIGGIGLVVPSGTLVTPLGFASSAAWAQDADAADPDTETDDEADSAPAIPPLPTRRDEEAAREALLRRFTEAGWIIFKAPEQGFSVALPGEPTVTAKPVAGHTPLIQHDYQVDPGDGTAYHTIVFEYPEGRTPEIDVAYYRRLVEAYAKGSGSSVSREGPARIARHHGYEATAIDKNNGLIHIIDLIPSEDRVYMLVTAGPAGHASSEGALRFRQSFRLIDPDATPQEQAEEETVDMEPPTPEGPAIERTAPETPLATEEDLLGEETVEEAPVEEAAPDSEDAEPEAEIAAPESASPEDEAPEGATPDDASPEPDVAGEPDTAEEPESGESLYDGKPDTPETAEPEADETSEVPSDGDALEQYEKADDDTGPSEQSPPAEDAAPADEDLTEPEAQSSEPAEETPSETAPVPPLPDEDAETGPAPDQEAIDEMPPVEDAAPEDSETPAEPDEEETEAPSDEPSAEEPEAGAEPESAAPDPQDSAPEAGEPDDDPSAEESPDTEDDGETPPALPDHTPPDPDEQFSI